MRNFKINVNGITLIALVVTIVVLLILAGVSIAMLTGEDGLIKMATKAANEYKKASEEEQQALNDLGNLLLNHLQIKDNLGKVIDENKNTTVYDEYNNPIEIPAGFSIVPNGKNNVEYSYTETETHIPSVQDGIVITDQIDEEGNSTGNEFVWIPVGKINNKEGESTEIELGRYDFDIQLNEDGTLITGTGNETLVQSAENYDKEADEEENSKYRIYGINSSNVYYYESTKGLGNSVAKDLKGFINSATEKGGYYLARYEAGHGTDEKVISKAGTVWNNVTQLEAATAAQEMYTGNNFTSDLTNSYAWDTAVVFIQKYQEINEKKYSMQTAKNYSSDKSSPDNTGERTTETTDKINNIYDMASNCFEWTTETRKTIDGAAPNVSAAMRGGDYSKNTYWTCNRRQQAQDRKNVRYSFRPILYVSMSN